MPRAETNGAPPPLKVEYVPINKVLRYAQNTRDHSEAQVELIMASMREAGFTNPCLVDAKGVLIAGHARTEAASRLGIKKVPVIRLGHLTETQARALRIKDNSLALLATWNEDMLRLELPELQLVDYPLNLLGFSDDQLEVHLNGWGDASDPTGHDGAHTDGISSTIFVTVQPPDTDRAKEAITKALAKSGIKHDLGGRS